MLAPLALPACAHELNLATQLAVEILGYGARAPAPNFEELADQVPSSGTVTRMQRVRERISVVFDLSVEDRVELAQAVAADARFVEHLDSETFDFAFAALRPEAHSAGKAFMVSMYEDVLRGHGYSRLEGQSIEPFNAEVFEASYRDANTAATVCPACLGTLQGGIDRASAVDREHYFPKSLYPPLAIHPFNLVLTCMTCNQRAHGQKDPIDNPGPGAILGVYIPYRRAALADLSLAFDLERTTVVALNPEPPSDEVRRRLTSLNALYEIENQWSDRLATYVHDALIGELLLRVLPLTVDGVERELGVMAEVLQSQITTVPDAFLRLHYLRWLRENLDLTFETVQAREAA